MTIHDYVRAVRDNIFEGEARAIYFNDLRSLQEFLAHPPDIRLEGIPIPPVDEAEWPIAIVYNSEIYWVDSNGTLWGLPDGVLVRIKSKEWLPVE